MPRPEAHSTSTLTSAIIPSVLMVSLKGFDRSIFYSTMWKAQNKLVPVTRWSQLRKLWREICTFIFRGPATASPRSSCRARLTALISPRSSHRTHLTALISPRSSHRTHLTALISPRSSHRTHLTALISPRSSHRTHLTALISLRSSHRTHLTALISPHSSHRAHLTAIYSTTVFLRYASV
ncbi:hypothetical protein V8B97DRAFT_1333303 [Scleroderma yunnanense]